MLITSYDSQDAYFTEEDIEEMQLDEDDREPGYDEDYDNMYFDDFRYDALQVLSKRKYPLVLRANNSNWQGKTGFATVDSADELLGKVFSFDSSYYELHRTRGSALHFRLATHDVPQSFSIDLLPFNQAYWEK